MKTRSAAIGIKAAGRALLVFCLVPLGVAGQAASTLSQVKSIYVQPFKGMNGDEELQDSLIKRLKKSEVFEVAAELTQADAVLKCSGALWVRGYHAINYRDPASNRVPVYAGYLSVELIAPNGEPLWSYLAVPGKMGWKTVVDDMTSTVVKQLVAAHAAPSTGAVGVGGANGAAATLTGAGATFPAPLYQLWFETLRDVDHITITYAAVGSEEGMRQLAAGKVDFAASEVAPSEDYELEKKAGEFLRVASVLGGVVPAYNLPEVHEYLRFTPEVLAEIYLGKITRWNDPRIVKLNKEAALPDEPIVVVHRADGSGTTNAWSTMLSRASAEWNMNVGSGMRLTWPTGIGADGNQEVAATVKTTPNSIGYVELVYAIQRELAYGAVRNRAGEFVRADLESLGIAASTVRGVGDAVSGPLEVAEKGAYPVATFTWLLVPRRVDDAAKKAALARMLQWALTSGQKACAALGYVPLPKALAERELQV
ncbi:MAG TPA: phosphate ABC transporter substrate-binding protein PstS, partial [Candidatus Bathyarchaeia archaeon]|nr:phosphate ABC transporter substrate-binding protein PstS [Candidatus Bathyarchaeia archaeon]